VWQRLLHTFCIKILGQVQPYVKDMKTGQTINTLLPSKKWPNMHKRKFKRETDMMPFIITYKAWNNLFREEGNKKKYC